MGAVPVVPAGERSAGGMAGRAIGMPACAAAVVVVEAPAAFAALPEVPEVPEVPEFPNALDVVVVPEPDPLEGEELQLAKPNRPRALSATANAIVRREELPRDMSRDRSPGRCGGWGRVPG